MKSLQLNEPHVIIMVGIPGSGKSFFAETFNVPLVSYGSISTALFSKDGHNRSQDIIIKRVAGILLSELLKSKQTIVFDGSTGTKLERAKIVAAIKSKGYKADLLWVQTESNTAQARATKRRKDGQYLSDDEFKSLVSNFSAPTKLEHAIVISGKHTYASQLKIVLKHLTENRLHSVNIIKKRILDKRIEIK